MEKSKEKEGEGGLVTVIACCTEKGEPSMKSKSSSRSVWRVRVGGDINWWFNLNEYERPKGFNSRNQIHYSTTVESSKQCWSVFFPLFLYILSQ